MERKMRFGENLGKELKSNGISQMELAKKLNTTQATISRWVGGLNEPDFTTLFLLCDIFDCSPNELLGWDD